MLLLVRCGFFAHKVLIICFSVMLSTLIVLYLFELILWLLSLCWKVATHKITHSHFADEHRIAWTSAREVAVRSLCVSPPWNCVKRMHHYHLWAKMYEEYMPPTRICCCGTKHISDREEACEALNGVPPKTFAPHKEDGASFENCFRFENAQMLMINKLRLVSCNAPV